MQFSPRESEVMGCLFEAGEATARQIWRDLGETRTYSTVRKLLSILEDKGYVSHRKEGQVFIYCPSVERQDAASSALGRLLDTFFKGSVENAVSSLLGERGKNVSSGELDRIARLIEEARRNNRSSTP